MYFSSLRGINLIFCRISAAELRTVKEQLFQNLFSAMEIQGSYENEYVMKGICLWHRFIRHTLFIRHHILFLFTIIWIEVLAFLQFHLLPYKHRFFVNLLCDFLHLLMHSVCFSNLDFQSVFPIWISNLDFQPGFSDCSNYALLFGFARNSFA